MPSGGYKRPLSINEAVVHELRHHIGAGTFHPGQRLVTEQVARRFGVSNQPVREALRILEAEGRVQYQRNRGYAVTRLAREELLEVYRLRDLLEDEAVMQSMARFPDERLADLDELGAAFEAAAAAGDPGQVRRTNREFHALLREFNPYPRLHAAVEQLRAVSAPYRARFFEQRIAWSELAGDHRLLVEAFRAGDQCRVSLIGRRHRARTVDGLLAAPEMRTA